MLKDLRREQVSLLRFEKLLQDQAKNKAAGQMVNRAAIIAGVASLSLTANAAAKKLHSEAPNEFATAMQQALPETGEISGELLVTLAEIIGKGHALVEKLAVEASFRLLEVGGGTGKGDPSNVVRSILGL